MKILGRYTGIGIGRNGYPEIRFQLDEMALNSIQKLPEGDYALDIKKPRNKRSLNQNALLWELIGNIDMKLNGNRAQDLDIYVQILQMAGSRIESLAMKKEALEEFKKRTEDVFRAWVVRDEWKNQKGIDWVQVHCFYGSSKMTTQEMARVIDVAIEYAERIGIDTDYWKGLLEDGQGLSD